MNRYKKFRVSTQEAMTAVCAVYRQLGNTVKKAELNDTSRTSKQMLMDHFSGVQNLDVTQADEIKAKETTDYLNQRLMLDSLKGSPNSPFILSVGALLEKDTVSSSDFGILAWAPKLVDDLIAQDDKQQDIRQVCHTSRYLGTVTKKIELTLHVLDCKYVKNYNSYVIIGHDGQGNAISCWTKHSMTGVNNVSARVKAHQKFNRLGNIPGTVINYVKIKKV